MGDDDDDDEDGSEDEDLAILQSALDVPCRSGEGVGPSGADRLVVTMTKEGSARKHAASSLLRVPSLKHPCTTIDAARAPHAWLLSTLPWRCLRL